MMTDPPIPHCHRCGKLSTAVVGDAFLGVPKCDGRCQAAPAFTQAGDANGVFRWALEIQQTARAAQSNWRASPDQNYWMDRMDEIIDRLGMEGRKLRDALFNGPEQRDAMLGAAMREASTVDVDGFVAFVGNGENALGRFPQSLTELDAILREYASRAGASVLVVDPSRSTPNQTPHANDA